MHGLNILFLKDLLNIQSHGKKRGTAFDLREANMAVKHKPLSNLKKEILQCVQNEALREAVREDNSPSS